MSRSVSLGRLKVIFALLIALSIVVGAGIVVGQAPELFGAEVAEEPEASITFEQQEADGQSVEISSVSLSEGGFVVVTDERNAIVGVSDYLGSGSHENVTVEAAEDTDRELYGRLTATVYQDETDDETFRPDPDDEPGDRPYIVDGYPVSDTATVTAVERPDDAATSFRVNSLDGPSTGMTSETATFTTEIENPTENELRQYAAFRVNGELLERKVFSLAPGETREITFEIDLKEVGNGSHIYGVYTEMDGAHGEIDVEYDGPAHVSIEEATTERVIVEAGVPDGGYVAAEDDNGTIVGVSRQLGPGIHESVEITLDGVENGSNLTVYAYRDDPEGESEPTPYEIDGEPVRATAELAEADTDD